MVRRGVMTDVDSEHTGGFSPPLRPPPILGVVEGRGRGGRRGRSIVGEGNDDDDDDEEKNTSGCRIGYASLKIFL